MSDEHDTPAVPPPGRGAVPEWSPPPPGYPDRPPTYGAPAAPPTAPVPAVPPVGGPTATAPPAATTAPVPVVPLAAAPAPTTGAPAPAGTYAPPPVPSGMANWMKIVLALAATSIVVGLIGIAATSGPGSTPRPVVTVDQCDITARGEVIAGGTVTNRDDVRRTARLELRLSSLRGGTWSTTTRVERLLGPGDEEGWTTSVVAPSNVEQVRCEVTDASLD